MQERLTEYEERAANETQTVPVEALDEGGFWELSAVDKALGKIQQGGYGICELCGQEMEVKRLQSIPDAERCLNCAAQRVPMLERASEEEEEPAGQTALPPDLTGMDDGELAEWLLDRIRTGNIVAAEKLEFSSDRGLIRLEGFLPSEKSRKILL